MFRRMFVVTIFVVLALACAAAPALAYGPYLSYPVDGNARLVPGTSQAVYLWSEPGAGATTRLMASRVQLSSGSADGPYTVVSDINALGAWHASGDGLNVTVVWEDGASVWVARIDLSDGDVVYGPSLVCTDAQTIALYGRTVSPRGVVADGNGGAYVWCSLFPTSTAQGVGDSLINHVSPAGMLAQAAPGARVGSGTIAGMVAADQGDALALLTSPGRSRVAVRRYDADLTAEWTRSPYLIEPASVVSSEPVGIIGGASAVVAWREGAKVKVQRFAPTGSPRFLSPPGVTMAGVVQAAPDGFGGVYLVGPSGTGLVARHVLASGFDASWNPSTITDVGTTPRVYGLANNEAGDLFVASGDGAAGAVHGVSLLTYLGSWKYVGPASAPEWYSGVIPDGAGGAWAMGGGGNARLWHITAEAQQVTFRARAKVVTFGKSVGVAGYDTAAGGSPVSGAQIRIQPVSGPGAVVTATTGQRGYYGATLKPVANATWTATAGGIEADPVTIQVAPRITLALSHLKAGQKLTEVFTGAVTPTHAGKRLYIQKAFGSGWRTVASGRIDSRSRYRVDWVLPYRTARYKVRAMFKADTDHATGVSQTATLRVVIKKG